LILFFPAASTALFVSLTSETVPYNILLLPPSCAVRRLLEFQNKEIYL